MDAKRYHQARGHRQQVDRLDSVCKGMSHVQRDLTQLAKPGNGVKLVVEFDLHDGYVDTVRIARETRIYKIPRQAAA